MKRRILIFAIAVVVFFIFPVINSSAETKIEFLLDWQMASCFAPYLYAKEKGYYDSFGLDVTIIEGKGAEMSARLIGDGKYKIGTCNALATAIAIDHNIPIVSVGVLEQDAVTAIFSLAESNIKAPQDLIGKKLGVRYYDISHKDYLMMMKAQGLSPENVKEVEVNFELQPLLTKQVDALYNYFYNMPVILKSKGYTINEIRVKDWGVNGYGFNIIANKKFSAQHPDVIEKFICATRKAWKEAKTNPERVINVLIKKYPELDAKAALQSLITQAELIVPVGEHPLFFQDDQKWNQAISLYKELGFVKDNISPSDVYTNKFLGKECDQ